MTSYNSDIAIIKHIFNDILPHLMKKYQFTDEDIVKVIDAKGVFFKLIKKIEQEPNNGQTQG